MNLAAHPARSSEKRTQGGDPRAAFGCLGDRVTVFGTVIERNFQTEICLPLSPCVAA